MQVGRLISVMASENGEPDMQDSDSESGDEERRPSASVQAQIDDNLRRLFESELTDELPPALAELVARLDAEALEDGAEEPSATDMDTESAPVFRHRRQVK